MTEEEISIKMDEEETAERVWRRVAYVLAFVTLSLLFTGLFAHTLTLLPTNIIVAVTYIAGITGFFAWVCSRTEVEHIQNQRVLDWNYFNANAVDEEELDDLQADVWDLQRQIREKNQMICQLTEPVQTVRVRSITALAALPR